MHIHFKTVRWKNFLSTGNEFQEIQLDRSKSTLIMGENGAGKSTMIDALSYGLYGKPYRNINKPQLVNSITTKGLVVEVEFRIGDKEYLVRRGMKYNLFEIFVNGELLNQAAMSKEYQEHLEKNILRMSHKSFCQVIVLGTAGFTPFMQLSAQNRREIVEDMLDLQIFSRMLVELKEIVSANKQAIQENEFNFRLIDEKVALHKKNALALKQNTSEIIQVKERNIAELEAEIFESEKSIHSLKDLKNELGDAIADYNALVRREDKINDGMATAKSKIRGHHSSIEFFDKNETCPTCKQDISEDFKKIFIEERMGNISEIDTMMEAANNRLKELQVMIQEAEVKVDRLNTINKEISSLEAKVWAARRSINTYKSEIEDLHARKDNMTEADNDTFLKLLREKSELENCKEKLLEERSVNEVAMSMLKDNGIKTKIIKQYIPVINTIVNKYLAAMDFFVNFEVDEQFNEVIKSRHRDVFSYNSFSEGEKSRLDLALMLTWRDLAKLRNSASTNLLILDEVFDGSLDGAGSDDLLSILVGDADNAPFENVFVISHARAEMLYDKFHSVIKFRKVKNFSQME